jgi:hypothetical protein
MTLTHEQFEALIFSVLTGMFMTLDKMAEAYREGRYQTAALYAERAEKMFAAKRDVAPGHSDIIDLMNGEQLEAYAVILTHR